MVICAACWSLELWQRELAVYVSVIIQSTGQNIVPPRVNVYPVLAFSSMKKNKDPCNFSGIWVVWYIWKWNLINSGVSSMLPLCRSQIQMFSGWSHESFSLSLNRECWKQPCPLSILLGSHALILVCSLFCNVVFPLVMACSCEF